MAQKFQGQFKPKHPGKYEGDPTNIVFRSGWELAVMVWLDGKESVKKWSSEEIVIPYKCRTDGRLHRYFVDFKVTFTNDTVLLVEVKPARETKPPVMKKGKRKATHIKESLTFAKNLSKWEAAKVYAERKGWTFQVWTEDILKRIGVKIIDK